MTTLDAICLAIDAGSKVDNFLVATAQFADRVWPGLILAGAVSTVWRLFTAASDHRYRKQTGKAFRAQRIADQNELDTCKAIWNASREENQQP